MSHSADAGKMDCRHEPMEPVAEFVHVCKHCGVPIEAADCMSCDGKGILYITETSCFMCRGTGIDRWEVVT